MAEMTGAYRFGVGGVFLYLMLQLLLGGCSTSQHAIRDDGHGGKAEVIQTAKSMVGVPYRYGGASPRGFDCSGLVYYSYGKAGRQVPRSTEAQYAASSPVRIGAAIPGDILFFRIEGKPSHVGIYLGNGRFVHAPSGGKRVGYASLTDDYWSARLVKVGRF